MDRFTVTRPHLDDVAPYVDTFCIARLIQRPARFFRMFATHFAQCDSTQKKAKISIDGLSGFVTIRLGLSGAV
jgi:hypothetical protein